MVAGIYITTMRVRMKFVQMEKYTKKTPTKQTNKTKKSHTQKNETTNKQKTKPKKSQKLCT